MGLDASRPLREHNIYSKLTGTCEDSGFWGGHQPTLCVSTAENTTGVLGHSLYIFLRYSCIALA